MDLITNIKIKEISLLVKLRGLFFIQALGECLSCLYARAGCASNQWDNLLELLWTHLQEQFLHSLIRILVEAVVLSNAPTSWLFCVFSLFVLFLRTLCYSKKKRKKREGLGAHVRRQRPADRPTTNVPHSKSSNTRIEKWQIKCNPLRNTYQARQKHIWWQVEGYVVHSLGTSSAKCKHASPSTLNWVFALKDLWWKHSPARTTTQHHAYCLANVNSRLQGN